MLLWPTTRICGPLSVPAHTELKRGTLRYLIADAGMTVEDFLLLL